jgi:phytoene/squalene synthetase
MDLDRMIRELRERRRYLDRVIAALEQLARLTFSQTTLAKPEPGRRGRKFMTNEERRAVSERMKKYWTTRRSSRNGDKKPKVGPSSAS